jgi:hypothetical protein
MKIYFRMAFAHEEPEITHPDSLHNAQDLFATSTNLDASDICHGLAQREKPRSAVDLIAETLGAPPNSGRASASDRRAPCN